MTPIFEVKPMLLRAGLLLFYFTLYTAISSFSFPVALSDNLDAHMDGRRGLASTGASGSQQIYRDTGPYFLDFNTHNEITIAGTLSFLEYYSDDPEGNYVAIAWDMFNAWVNMAKGGVPLPSDPTNPYLFRLIYVDDFSSVEITNSTYVYMAQMYDYLLSPTADDLTIAAIDVAEKYNKVLISAHTSGTSVFLGKNKSFSMLPSDHWYHEIGFATYAPFSPGSIAVVRDAEFYVCSSAELSKIYGDKYGYSEVYHYEVDGANLTAVRELMMILKENNVSVFYGCSHTSLCETAIPAAKAANYNPRGMMFSSCIDAPTFYSEVAEDTRYVVLATPWVDTIDIRCAYTGWTPKEFSNKYFVYSNKLPTYFVAGTFASGLVLIAAIEAAGTLDTDLVAAKIKSMTFPTLYGNISFDSNNQAVLDFRAVQMRNATYYELINSTSIVYPMPSWASKQCMIDTDTCSGHGYCSEDGFCKCYPGYYDISGKCDAFCPGEIASDGQEKSFCKELKQIYIGALLPVGFNENLEVLSMVRLAVELVNNKTDGWFDNSTKQVEFILNVSQFTCSEDNGYKNAEALSNWAKSRGQPTLSGMIGAYCSSSSSGAAKFGGRESIPQISFTSTSVALSDKNTYPHFFRTCLSDEKQSGYLKSFMLQYGMRDVAVISTTDLYSSTLARDFIIGFSEAGGRILYRKEYTPGSVDQATFYDNLIIELIASGSPVILGSTYRAEIQKILDAANKTYAPLVGPDYMWLAVDEWVETVDVNPPLGTLGLGPKNYETDDPFLGDDFMELWETLDPSVYIDADGDRSSLFIYSASAIDAVFALAIAYQSVIDSNFQGNDVEYRRQVSKYLFDSLEFTGLTGTVRFDRFGDRELARYRINNYHADGWVTVGLSGLSGSEGGETINLDDSILIFPDGKTGSAARYSSQYTPICQPGLEPIDQAGKMVCNPCNVGYFKPYEGSQPCDPCPEGADCDDRGIAIPNILPKYWRQNPPTEEEKRDFDRYRIFRCDIDKNCIGGGPDLSNLCAPNFDPSYPICGVCADGYYLTSDNDCSECSGSDSFISAMEALMSIVTLLVVGAFLYFIHSQIIDKLPQAVPINVVDVKDVPDATLNKQGSSSNSGHDSPVGHIIHSPEVFVRHTFHTLKSHGVFVTVKLTVSFVQVLAGALLSIKVEWTFGISRLLSLIRYDPLESLSLFSGCKSTSHLSTFYVAQLLILYIPVAFTVLTFIVNRLVLYLNIAKGKITSANKEIAANRLRDMSIKALVWFCLFSYPILASGSLQYFNCRSLQYVGIFARGDYSVECDGEDYKFFSGVAGLNIILYPIGIPIFFYLLIRNRFQPWALVASVPLHSNFTNEWAYYEVFELFRKLLLTSVVGFVAPGSATQCLYLFAVDTAALLILTLCRPYAFDSDDFLSGILTLFECIIFLITFLIVSEVYASDNYNYTAMLDIVYALIIVALVTLVPLNIISKVPSLRSYVAASWAIIRRKTNMKVPEEVAMVVLGLDARTRYRRESEEFRASDLRLSRLSNTDLSKDNDWSDDDDPDYPLKPRKSAAAASSTPPPPPASTATSASLAPSPKSSSARPGRGGKSADGEQWFSNPATSTNRPRQRSSPTPSPPSPSSAASSTVTAVPFKVPAPTRLGAPSTASAAAEDSPKAMGNTVNRRASRFESV